MAAKEDVLASGVTSLSFLCQPDAEFAVSFNASPDVFFMNDKGSVAMVVKPTGAVHKPIEESSRRYSRHVEYTSEAEEQRQGLTCCDMTFNETRRFLVMGYSNGLVQLLDTSYQYIFLRVAPHERITSAVHTFSFDQTVFAAFSAGKEAVKLVPYIVKKRNIMDSKE
ncbi:hypothetical protein ADEAN_000299000 [Angomonas deanei]|uniref:WD domain, G-beta repeat n=1 Tax=Angomonas deanei TaxID=59799 RepID=A0A7G2C7W0_9TRYP|nr:hypothetical protein ADEAN_000299000 [Angomonas deanei]